MWNPNLSPHNFSTPEKALLVCSLVIVFLGLLFFLIYNSLELYTSLVFDASLNQAENNPGTCAATQLCTWVANDDLGLPSSQVPLTAFSATTALILADLIGRVEYAATNNVAISSPPAFVFVSSAQDSASPVFVGFWTAKQNGLTTLYMALRGTKTSQEWTYDLQTNQTPLQSSWPSITNANILVHTGFLAIFNQLKSAMDQVIRDTNPSQIMIAGHSLGAAVASLAGLAYFSVKPLVVYAFASPRVGNTGFSETISVSFPLFRISNQSDLVNDIPLAVMFNLQGNYNPYLYDQAGTNYSFNLNWGSWKNNHLLPVYTSCLSTVDCALTMIPWS